MKARNIITSLLATAGLVFTLSFGGAACGGDGDSCDAVVEHTLKIMPKEFAEMAKKDKAKMVKKCKEMPKEARECALKAKNLEQLSACPK